MKQTDKSFNEYKDLVQYHVDQLTRLSEQIQNATDYVGLSEIVGKYVSTSEELKRIFVYMPHN